MKILQKGGDEEHLPWQDVVITASWNVRTFKGYPRTEGSFSREVAVQA